MNLPLCTLFKQELKVKDDCYVKDLRNQAEELDLIMERLEEQIKTLTKAYREELVQVEVGPESSPGIPAGSLE